MQACDYATFYSSTVSLLPTHWANTNNVVARNRRIGVGIIDFTGWVERDGLFKVTKSLRRGYKVVTATNKWANGQAGVPEAIRKTTIKPGGTVPKLVGRTSGAGYPTFDYILRRMRVAANAPVVPIYKNAGVPFEPCVSDPAKPDGTGTLIFGFPVKSVGAKSAEKVTLWQQAANLVTLQREWADNSVSNTLYFKPRWVLDRVAFDFEGFVKLFDEWDCWNLPGFTVSDAIEMAKAGGGQIDNTMKVTVDHEGYRLFTYNSNHEEDDIEPVLASILPSIKACSLLPHTPNGVYRQTPEEGITKEEYERLRSTIQPIDWTQFSGSDGEDEKFCQGDTCVRPV